jgi:nucleotide-binding universal stress UspA family protein
MHPAATHRVIGPDGDVAGYLDGLAAPYREEGVPLDTAVCWDPISPGDGVARYLRSGEGAALVIVSSHARTGFKRLALGSAAAGIVHRCPAPVLVLPADDLF